MIYSVDCQYRPLVETEIEKGRKREYVIWLDAELNGKSVTITTTSIGMYLL